MARGEETRTRIMDIAQDSILAKGFDATSIDEIVVSADITKSGFFYHFRDKNALAAALLARYVAEEDELFDSLFARARDLSDDPLQVALIVLKLLAEIIDDMPNGHPGCIVATAVYQDRLFNREVRNMNRTAVVAWRERFHEPFEEVAAAYPMRDTVALENLADMVSAVIEGGIVVSRAVGEPKVTAQQVMLLRSYVKLLFSRRAG